MKTSEADMADVQSWASQHDRNHPGDVGTKVVRVMLELLVLREVADAARAMADERMSDGCDDGGNAMRERALYAALREAGR